jgi:hypothetical protein
VTNLDFIELLLEEGADPNAQDHDGLTPLLETTSYSPGAGKFLLTWPSTDADIPTRSGASSLAGVREIIASPSNEIAYPDNPGRMQREFLLRQWREIEEMLVERGAAETGITVFDVQASSTHWSRDLDFTTILADLVRKLKALETRPTCVGTTAIVDLNILPRDMVLATAEIRS